jgi:hypothetical protein
MGRDGCHNATMRDGLFLMGCDGCHHHNHEGRGNFRWVVMVAKVE